MAILDRYKSAVLADSPAMFLDVGASGTDLSGNGNNGAYNGGYTLNQAGPAADASVKSVLVDGTSGYISLGNPTTLKIVGQITLEAWVNCDFSKLSFLHTIISQGYVSNTETAFRFYKSPSILIQAGTATAQASWTATFATKTWQLLHSVYDGSAWNIWCNGSKVASVTASGNVITNGGWNIGAANISGSIGRFFPGDIAMTAIYSTALSSTQILAHYKAMTDPYQSVFNPPPGFFGRRAV